MDEKIHMHIKFVKANPFLSDLCLIVPCALRLEPYRGQVQGVIAGVRGLTPA